MYRWQSRVIISFMFLGFTLLVGQLFNLQIIDGIENRLTAEQNRLKKITIPAPRGQIFDRNNNALAVSQPQYSLLGDQEQVIDRITALRLQQDKNTSIITYPIRNYPFGNATTHLVGYLSPVALDELNSNKLRLEGYGATTTIGRLGVEAQYEKVLKGHDGSMLVEVDTMGKTKRFVSQLSATPGKSLTLAVDLRLQQVASRLMQGKKGAVVASDPKTGEIITFYSSPSYDPNIFIDGKDGQTINQLLNDENQPLYNRVIAGRYPPGSVFKLVTSLAGLSEGVITSQTTVNDTGVIRVGAFSYSNWYFTGYGRTEGEISLAKALARSTDTYYYKVGEWLGERKLIDWAKKFGVDLVTRIDIPGELPGFIATPEWKQANRGEGWFLGNTYHLAIGQGDLTMTPLGVNQMTSVIANNGKYCVPRVLKIGAINTPYQADCQDLNLDRSYISEIVKGMTMACSTGGTGWPLFGFKPSVACKTGTAETGVNMPTHAWITVFAPIDDPSIVLTVLVENGGEGSSVAGPIAKELLKVWFEDNK